MWLDNDGKGIIIVSASVEPCRFRIVSCQYKMKYNILYLVPHNLFDVFKINLIINLKLGVFS